MALPDANIQYLNQLINCIDPGKDAMIKFNIKDKEEGLKNDIHGPFLKNDIIFHLFNGNALDESDKSSIKGVGDEKQIIKTKIDASLKLNELPHQQIIRLKVSPTNDLRLDEVLYLTYDAGPGPEQFCKDYTLILTPGSIIDSAGKDKSYKKQVDVLSKSYDLNTKIIKEMDLDMCLTSIKFIPGKEYTFQIKTNIGGFEDKTIEFDKNTFNEVNSTYFAGNATKNKYIYENYKGNDDKKNEIMYLVLMKELGDTLQVAWLKDIILRGKLGLTADTTAICTCDTVVWLRSILNGVSCIFTNNHTSTFYPIAGNEIQKIAANALIKKQLKDKLEKNNNSVIKSLNDFKECLRYTADVEFHGKKISSENNLLVSNILTDIIKVLENIQKDIIKSLDPLPDLDSYREVVANSMFKSPFRVVLKTKDIEYVSTFTYFLKEKKRYSFYPNLIYSLLYKGIKTITREQIIGEELLKRISVPVALAVPDSAVFQEESDIPIEESNNVKMSGGSHSKETFKHIITLNIDNPGFLSYYTLIYLPEVLYITYSILYSYNFPIEYINTCAKLFNSKHIVNIIESFGKLNKDNKFDYNPKDTNENLKKMDTIFTSLYSILVYVKTNTIPKRHSIFDYCYDEIHWILELSEISIITKLNIELTEDRQGKVLDIYQELYDSESYLTIMNMREEKSPLDFIPIRVKSLIKAVKATVTKRNRMVQKNHTIKNKKSIKGFKGVKASKTTKKRQSIQRKNNRKTKRASNTSSRVVKSTQLMETPPKMGIV